MRTEVVEARPLRFADGTPVRAASGIARHGAGWLVVQDDSTLAASWDGTRCWPVRLLPAVEGLDLFDEASGTKELKPDLEAVVALSDGTVLALGSGSTPARMLAVHLRADGPVVHDLSPVYYRVADALDVSPDQLNLEGACLVGGSLRWFQRGLPSAGVPTASVDLDLAALLTGAADTGVSGVRRYDLGSVAGVGLAVTDAVTLADGRVLVSAAAEDAATTYDDGPVVGSALALLDDERVVASASLPGLEGGVAKVEGLALVEQHRHALDLLAVVDADDPHRPSLLLRLWVSGDAP
jgi:hypothetical protein